MRALQALAKQTAKARATQRAQHTKRIDPKTFAEDFLGFTALLEIIPKSGPKQKLKPNAIQSAFEATRSGRDIVLKPRQVGFTTWELARDIWYFLTRPGARVVVVVQSSTDFAALRETSEKVRVMFAALAAEGIALDFRVESVSEWMLGDSSLRIVQAGASEMAASKKGRSGTIHRLHITELAFFEHAQTTLNAMLECVPAPETGSEVMIESTANGAAGLFYEKYQAAKNGVGAGYAPRFFRWLDHDEYTMPLDAGEAIEPRTDREQKLVQFGAKPEQIKWYRRKVEDKGQDLVDQEYPIDEVTCWLVPGRTFFDKERTLALQLKTRSPIAIEMAGALRIWQRPQPKQTYVIAVDPSEGTGGDPGAAVVYDRATGEHVATLHGQFPPWKLAEAVAKLGTTYNTATIVVERNNHGHAVLQALSMPPEDAGRNRYPKIYRSPKDGNLGWHSTEITRSTALDALENGHRTGEWETPDVGVIAEMLTFIVNKNGKAEAAPGSHDDLVMASAIAWAICIKPIPDQGPDAPMPQPRGSFESRRIG